MAKTTDGFRLSDLVRTLAQIPGVHIESGSKHPYVAKYELAPVGICAIAESTSVQDHLVPWLKKATGESKNRIYESLRSGEWLYGRSA